MTSELPERDDRPVHFDRAAYLAASQQRFTAEEAIVAPVRGHLERSGGIPGGGEVVAAPD